jgi:hypothetical protein
MSTQPEMPEAHVPGAGISNHDGHSTLLVEGLEDYEMHTGNEGHATGHNIDDHNMNFSLLYTELHHDAYNNSVRTFVCPAWNPTCMKISTRGMSLQILRYNFLVH